MPRSCLVAAVAAALAFSVAPAFAQAAGGQVPAGTAAPPKQKTLQTVEVTGTRIKSADVASETPIIKLTGKDIQKTGLTSIGDVLQQLSIAGPAINTHSDASGNFGSPADGSGVGAGATRIALRNIEAKRTLVLVDGLRWINGASASGVPAAVDLNTIPVSAIERIEILSDGASALYGSDAIGGVVNIVTKKSQQGAEANIYYGEHSIGGGATTQGDLSFGGQGDKYSFFVDASYRNEKQILAGAWDRNSLCKPGTGHATCSSATPMGTVQFSAPGGDTYGGLCPKGICYLTPDAALPPGDVQSFPDGYHRFGTADRFAYGPTELMMTPTRRTSLFTNIDYHLSDDVSVWFRGLATKRHSNQSAAATPQAFGVGVSQTGTVGAIASVDVTNPYNPFGFTLDDTDPHFVIRRRMVEGGRRIYTQDVNTTYFAGGLTGSFGIGDRIFNWDASVLRSNNSAHQTVQGVYNQTRINEALGPVSVCNADPQCVPLNIFGGPGSITPEMLAFIEYTGTAQSHQGLSEASANISGDLFKLPAGWLDFAFGYEHRNQSGSFTPGALTISGEAGGQPIAPTAGSFSVDSAYLELNAPLLTDVPLAKSLSIDVATRYSKYSTFGSTTNTRVGLRWQPFSDLTLRGTWGRGFRAPSIGELFGSASFLSSFIVDPCNFDSGLMNAQVAANCRKLGVPDPTTFKQGNIQINTETGGNRALQPEISRNVSMGAVYSPSWGANTGWSRSLNFDVTLYRIRITDAIQATDAQGLLNRCAVTLNPQYCDTITRNAIGDVTLINDTLENLGRIDTSGIDFGVTWLGNETAIGSFNASLQGTYLKYYRQLDGLTNALEPQAPDIEVGGGTDGMPRVKAQLQLGWTRGNWGANWTMRYISAMIEDCAGAAGLPVCRDPHSTSPRFPDGANPQGAAVYNDVRVNWTLPIKTPVTLAGGINNVVAHEAPLCLSCQLNGYDASNYPLPGRFWYVSAGVKF
jgi:iron complex outermembrane receptor protein